MPTWLKVLIVALLLLLAGTLPLAMQRDTGSLEGTIADEIGPVAGAKVEVWHMATGEAAQTNSDNSGSYRLDGLHRGSYSLWITAARHESVNIPKVFVETGTVTRKDIHMNTTGRRSIENESLLPR
jgi:hypothetical protein